MFTETMTVPRPHEVIGTVTVRGDHFTMRGGTLDAELMAVMQNARQKGADAVKVVSVQTPGFDNTSYSVVADLLRYTDHWEMVDLTEAGFQAYLAVHRGNLDPVEGIWDRAGWGQSRIAIMRDHSRPGRDFVGFTLASENLAWPPGFKKLELTRGPQTGSYYLTFYLDDFSRQKTEILVREPPAFTIAIQTQGEEDTLTFHYFKE